MAEGGGGKSDIEAGRAYVELFLKDAAWSKGLTAASAKLKNFGKGLSIVGGAIAAAGGLITAPLLEMTREFAKSAEELVNMSSRTGISAKELQFLGFAAEKTGTDLEKIQKAAFKAAKEGKSFNAMANEIAAIQNPAAQSRKAIELFGAKAGPFLLPMIRDIGRLHEEFEKLGLGMSEQDVEAGKQLSESFIDLHAVIRQVRDVIGASLAPTVRKAVEWIKNIAVSVARWTKAHRELFPTLLKVGTIIAGVGTAIVALGGFIAAAGVILGAFNGVLGLVAGSLGFLLSPIGLVVGGLVGLATWFVTSTNAGRAMVQGLIGWFGNLRDYALDVFQGIADALAGGNLTLAATIAFSGLKVIWLNGVAELQAIWGGLIIAGNAVWGALERGWSHTTEFVGNLWDETVTGIRIGLNNLIGWFQKAWSFIRHLSTAEFARINAETNASNAIMANDAADRIRARAEAAERARQKSRQLEEQVPNFANADAIAAAESAAKKAQEKLDELRKQAAKERKDKELAGAPGFQNGQFDIGAVNNKLFGTFNAALAARGDQGESPTVRELREGKRIWLDQLKEMQLWRGALKQVGLIT